jgi:hypothetical protein
MALTSLFLPLAELTFLTPPRGGVSSAGFSLSPDLFLLLVALAVLAGIVSLLRALPPKRRHHRPDRNASRKTRGGRPAPSRPIPKLQNPILVDGSNVMHWKDDKPQIFPVQAVVLELKRRGFTPGVVFDANAGYKLNGRFMNEREFSMLLTLPESQVFVVPKGTQADPYLLDAARGFGARVVTLDRFRDWAKAHPEVNEPGFLIRGGYRATGEFWLADAMPVPEAASV